MESKKFWQLLGATTLLTLLLVAALHTFPRLTPHWPLAALSILLFTSLSVLLFFLGKRAATATNKHLFTNLVMGFTLVKMLLSGTVVVFYTLLVEPENKLFVLPFFLVYSLYTALEVYVMVKLARNTSTPSAE